MSRNNNPKVDVSLWVNEKRVLVHLIWQPLLRGWQCFKHGTCLKLKAGRKSWGLKVNGVCGKCGMVVPLQIRVSLLKTRGGSSQARNGVLESRSIIPEECMDIPRKSCVKENVEFGGIALQKTFFFNIYPAPPAELNKKIWLYLIWLSGWFLVVALLMKRKLPDLQMRKCPSWIALLS